MALPPFINCIVPEGAKPTLEVFTTAVRVTLLPDWAVVALEEAVVVVAA